MSKYLFVPLCLAGGYLVLLSPITQHIGNHIDIAHSAGQFSHGEPVRTHFTSVSLFDKALSFFVSVFLQFTDNSNPDTTLFAAYFMLAGLMPNLVLWEIEATRARSKGRVVRYPLPWNLALQTLGFCTVAPIYFFSSLHSSSPGTGSPELPTNRAAALLPSLILSYVLPTAAMFFPNISAHTRQLFIGLWQFFPVYFWFAQNTLCNVLSRAGNDLTYLRRTYGFMVLLAAAVHGYTLKYILSSADPAGTLKTMFLPSFATPKGLAEVAFTFIQWDFIIGVSATMMWMAGCVWQCVREKGVGKALALGAGMVVGGLLVSPAAVIAAGFGWREERLREEYAKPKEE